MDGSALADVGKLESLFEMLNGLHHNNDGASCGLPAGQKTFCNLRESDQPRRSTEQSVCNNDADCQGEYVRILAQLSADIPELLHNTLSAPVVQLATNLPGNTCSTSGDTLQRSKGDDLLPFGRLNQSSISGDTPPLPSRQGVNQHTAVLRFLAPPPSDSVSLSNGSLANGTSACVSDEPCWHLHHFGHGSVQQSTAVQPAATNAARHNASGAAASFVTDMGVGPGGTDRVGSGRCGGHKSASGSSTAAFRMPAPSIPCTNVEPTAFTVPLATAPPAALDSPVSCHVRLCTFTAHERATLSNATKPNAMLFQGVGSSSLNAVCQPRRVHCGWDASVLPDATRPNLESVAGAQPRHWQAPNQTSELATARAAPAIALAGAAATQSASLFVKGLPPGGSHQLAGLDPLSNTEVLSVDVHCALYCRLHRRRGAELCCCFPPKGCGHPHVAMMRTPCHTLKPYSNALACC
jgi:hypothetical protein